MSRKPAVAAPGWSRPVEKKLSSRLAISVITPLFGGGFEPGAVDRDQPVRPAEIRGNLRFWWRAVNGSAFGSPAGLFDAESKIWGSVDSFSPIELSVKVTNPGTDRSPAELVTGPDPKAGPGLGYFLFPFQEEDRRKARRGGDDSPKQQAGVSKQITPARKGVEFILTVEFPEQYRADVETTLKAWLTFGGIGARTRRGCGSLSGPPNYLPPPGRGELEQWLSGLCGRGANGTSATTVLCGSSVLFGPKADDPMEAWRRVATFWARFRKGHVGGIQYTPMRGGDWSDYDTLGQLRPGRPQAASIKLNKPYLGLPIIYQDLPKARFTGTVEPADSGRMSSPIILKPVKFSDGSIRPGLLVMSAPAPRSIKIKRPDPGKTGDDVSSPDYELSPNANDKVLLRLRAAGMIDAVICAAREYFGKDCLLFRIGGSI